jgi:tetratricopeptide (TPR) repeat protein
LAALRDLCLTIGLKIEQKEYNIFSSKDNEGDLPFQPENIVELQAIPKHILLESIETTNIIEAADAQLALFKVEEAMELYNTAVQYLSGLYGGLHRDIAKVHHKIATIYYRLTDYDSAISCENNSLEILKLLYGEDNVDTIECISNIGLYYFSKGNKDKALYYLYKSLFLCNFAFGESYPEAIVNYMNISTIYQNNRQFQLAIVCMMETL